jgi:hypothetical protein
MGKKKISVILLTLPFVFNSCIIDTIPLGYAVRNCTNDTLLIELTKSDTFEGRMYCDNYPASTVGTVPEDTLVAYVHGKKTIFSSYHRMLPDSVSGYIYPLGEDTCYLYTITWQVATRFSLEEIRRKWLYDWRSLTKEDFDASTRLYAYKAKDADVSRER